MCARIALCFFSVYWVDLVRPILCSLMAIVQCILLIDKTKMQQKKGLYKKNRQDKKAQIMHETKSYN